MDPVSAGFSLAASVGTLFHVANRLLEVAAKFKDLEKALNILHHDVNGLLMLAELLDKIIKNVDGALDSVTVTQKDKEEHALPLFNSDIKEIAEELNQLLSCCEGRRSKWWPKWFQSLPGGARYLLKEGKIKELTARMGRSQFNLLTVVSMASLKLQVDTHAAPARASGVENAGQHVSELSSKVEKLITAQFRTITEQMLREQRLRSSSPALKGGHLARMAFNNKSTTSFKACMRSLPDLLRTKSQGIGGEQENSVADQTNENVSFMNVHELKCTGASIVEQRKDGVQGMFPNGTHPAKSQSESDTSEFNRICTVDTAILSEISLASLSETSDNQSIREISRHPIITLQAVTHDTLTIPSKDSEMNDGHRDKIVTEYKENSKQDMKDTGHDNTIENPKSPNCTERGQNNDWASSDQIRRFNETNSAAGLESEESAMSEMGSMDDRNDGQGRCYHPNHRENVWLVCRCGHIANSRLGFSSCPKCTAGDIIKDSQLVGKIGHWIGASIPTFGGLWG